MPSDGSSAMVRKRNSFRCVRPLEAFCLQQQRCRWLRRHGRCCAVSWRTRRKADSSKIHL